MSNYKAEATAYELADELARRTGLSAIWANIAGVPSAIVGETALKTAGGFVVQIQDQRGEADAGWDALPGFGGVAQPVYTTGVAKIILESTQDVSVAVASATGTLTLTNGAPITALSTITINGIVLTEGTDFAGGADDEASATAIAAAINAHPLLKDLVTAVANAGAPATVVITAKNAGANGNLITTTETAGNAAWGGATMTGGAGASFSTILPFSTFLKVWAAVAKRGLKMELWQTPVGTPPTNTSFVPNTSYLQAEFYPNEFWPLQGLV